MHTEDDVASDTSNTTAAATAGVAGWPVRALHFWRSPSDQPRWARPALLSIAVVAVVAYSYGIANASLETFYAGAVRSMSENWHDFFFASFDPWGTISVDKLPGSFWLQALSVRIFGFHIWAFVLPQVIEGTLTVLVLYRVVRRVAGPAAGLVAALALAVSPATVLLNRGNISDTLLILLLVLAADATTSAIQSGRWQTLLLAGVFVGLAFQAKMLQAWLELPAFYLAYLLAAPAASLYRRLGHIGLSVLAVLVVSLSWMSVVTLVPAHDRPYVDGSCDNSVFSQVFLYNGADRLTGNVLTQPGCRPVPPPIKTAALHLARKDLGTIHIPGGVGRFLDGGFGRLAAWLFPPSVVAIVALLFRRRKAPRTDPIRSATVLWTTWLFFTWCFFASSKDLNSYYLAALIPPMAALCAMGLAEAWRARAGSLVARLVLMATVPAAVQCRGAVLGLGDHDRRHGGRVGVHCRIVPDRRAPPLDRAGRLRPLRPGPVVGPGLGVQHGGGRPARSIRFALPVGQSHRTAVSQPELQPGIDPVHRRLRRAVPAVPGGQHRRLLGRRWLRHLRHRA
jgi:4-amino-4-deoxy-L-arabinose transferase-like glycosyltransferase